MRLKIIVTFLSISGGIISGEALRCEYCRGNACNEDDVPKLDCDNHISTLPYNFDVNYSNYENAVTGCLELEYLKGRRRVPIRQCLSFSQDNNVCNEIRFSLPTSVKLESCNVIRHKRDAEDEPTEATEESSTDTDAPLEESSLDIPTTLIHSTSDGPTSTLLITTPPIISSSEVPQITALLQQLPTSEMITESATLSNEIPKLANPTLVAVTQKATAVEIPKTAALISNVSTVAVKVHTTTPSLNISAVTHRITITTPSAMTTTPGRSSNVLCISLATLLLAMLIHVV